MARQNHGPLSRAKGKLGGVVYQQYEGMQVSREYQPVVKNPQTANQTTNRAKFKMASQIVAQFASTLNVRLAKLSIYTRNRRGAAINAIYNVITDLTPSSPEAVVDSVIAAINAKSLSGIAGPAIANLSGSTSTITAANGDTVAYTVVQYDVNGAPISVEENEYKSDGTAKAIDVLTAEGSATSVAMAVAFHALTEEGRAIISNTQGSDRTWMINITRGISAGDIEISALVGKGFKA